jgi:hypothetical protein
MCLALHSGDLSEIIGYGIRPYLDNIVRELVKTLDPMYVVKRVKKNGGGHQHGPDCDHDHDEDEGEGNISFPSLCQASHGINMTMSMSCNS